MDETDDLPEPRRHPIWLVTFADVTALLLAFFVMLFLMKNLQSEKWADIISQLSTSEKPTVKQIIPPPTAAKNIGKVEVREALPLNYLANVLEKNLVADEVLNTAAVHRLDGLVVVSLPSDTLFHPGQAKLTPGAREALFRIGGIVASLGNLVDVRGHTDPAPDSSGAFGSKWAISLARAAAVANELRRTGYRRPISIYGLADTRFVHLDSRLPRQARFRLARRVDIVIHPHSGDT